MWRVGQQIPRNLYRDDEPIAMLATEELAAELAAKLNQSESYREALQQFVTILNDEEPESFARFLSAARKAEGVLKEKP